MLFASSLSPNQHLDRLITAQQRGLVLAVAAHYDMDAWVEGARNFDHFPGLESVGCGDDQHVRACDMGLDQHRRSGHIAHHFTGCVNVDLSDVLALTSCGRWPEYWTIRNARLE